MTGSGDARVGTTATQWRTESRFYRRSPGWGWLLGLLLIPLLFGWLGFGALKPKVDIDAPNINVTAPNVSMPSLNFSPLSILRNGKDFTLSGLLPDLAIKDKLLGVLKAALGPGVNLIDKIDLAAGASAPDFNGLGDLLKAAADVPDFRFTAEGGPGEIKIAPGAPGDLEHLYLDGETIYLQNSAYVASTPGVGVESKYQGLMKGFFSGESLFLIRCSGRGDLWFNTFGAILQVDVTDNYVVDTGHIVAFTDGLEYDVQRVGGYKSLFLSGEGLVCRFRGSGKVWIQTRQVPAFSGWVYPYRPVKNKS